MQRDQAPGQCQQRRLLRALNGHSMWPCLNPLDLLEIQPYTSAPARRGDVVFCLPLNSDRAVVHRVVAVGSDGMRTRGDNSARVDPWLLQPDQIDGRVVAAFRGELRREIHGGQRGVWQGRAARLQSSVDHGLRDLLRPAYRSLEALMDGRQPLRPSSRLAKLSKLRLLELKVRGESRLELVIGRLRVGVYDATRQSWWIRPPFRLLLDAGRLPNPDRDRQE